MAKRVTPAGIAKALAPWFERAQRDLAWRRTRDPYAIWVSEIMLQQTRVETVSRYYAAFVARFPTVSQLADAPESDVLEAWSGLGYYRRARLLHAGAKHVVDRLGGRVPADADGLRGVPGIGRYTAGAIRSIAFDRPEALVDGNVARVLSRVYRVEDPKQQAATSGEHWTRTQAILECGSPRVLAQALMELGATVCTPKAPRCDDCPLEAKCVARAANVVDTIPAARTKTPQPKTRYAALLVTHAGRLLWVRRAQQGLLAGMWCMPLLPLGPRRKRPADADVTDVLGTKGRIGRPMSMVRHVFTHRIWELHPVSVDVDEEPSRLGVEGQATAWIDVGSAPRGGIPAVTRKIIAGL